ncbi:MAG: hypothetical protein O3B41_06350 [Bacteroidetes bacterium]|nr:hypothetical protein [Bacteroidota bacterium]
MKRFIAPLVLGLGIVFFATGCDGDSGTKAPNPKVQMSISTTTLKPLKEGFLYKAWARVDGVYYPTDAFNVTETGQFLTSGSQFRDKSFVLEADITDADLVLISIEGKTGSATAPSNSVILAGDVSGVNATLTSAHTDAMGGNLTGQTGQLTIMTPSDIDLTNEAFGVWYVTVSGTVLTKGLTLPTLNPGWVYQGWVEVGGNLLSTGRFRSTNLSDSNLYGFPDGPSFPGEDFFINPPTGVTFPLNLANAKISITVEPQPDDSADPSGIVVLTGQLPAAIVGRSAHALTATGAAIPNATISIF